MCSWNNVTYVFVIVKKQFPHHNFVFSYITINLHTHQYMSYLALIFSWRNKFNTFKL